MNASFFSIDKSLITVDERELKRRLMVSSDADVSQYGTAVEAVLSESTPKACFVRVPVAVNEGTVEFPFGNFASRDLAKNLSGCDEAFVFAVTLGHSADRLISKMSRLSPAEHFIYDAVGSALAECVCDEAERIIKDNAPDIACKPRFSPGYGDFPLCAQKSVLSALNAERLIGITLTGSDLMLPQKSITAVMGVC